MIQSLLSFYSPPTPSETGGNRKFPSSVEACHNGMLGCRVKTAETEEGRAVAGKLDMRQKMIRQSDFSQKSSLSAQIGIPESPDLETDFPLSEFGNHLASN